MGITTQFEENAFKLSMANRGDLLTLSTANNVERMKRRAVFKSSNFSRSLNQMQPNRVAQPTGFRDRMDTMNKPKRGDPKFALHTRKIDLKRGDPDEEVPDEGTGLDTRSLTRMQETIVPRSSITSGIKTINATFTPKNDKNFSSPFARDSFHSKKRLFMQKTQSVEEPEVKPRSSFLVEDDGEPVQVGSNFKAPKRGQVKLTKDYRKIRAGRKLEVYARFLQQCWRARKRRSFGCHFHSLDTVDSPFSRLKRALKGFYLGWKVR